MAVSKVILVSLLFTFCQVQAQLNATCWSLKYQDNFYQYIPLFLAKFYYSDEIQTSGNLTGNCFNSIKIRT